MSEVAIDTFITDTSRITTFIELVRVPPTYPSRGPWRCKA